MSDAENVSPRWMAPETVEGFRTSGPNPVLMAWAATLRSSTPQRLLDVGCGAARNAIPLARLGFSVVGTDLSDPMLEAARVRAREEAPGLAMDFQRAPMAPLPFADASFDVVVAHGIWNLARSALEFRAAVDEAARVTRPGGHLFVFTFSRNTLPRDAAPVDGEPYVFTQFNGEPQCFLTENQLVEELARGGFARNPPGPLTEYNVPRPLVGPPAIYEGTFLRR
jgi:SAM-dependent methyltransferase